MRYIGPIKTFTSWQRGVAHFHAVPLLTTPAVALGVDDAGAAAAAAWVFVHSVLPEVNLGTFEASDHATDGPKRCRCHR